VQSHPYVAVTRSIWRSVRKVPDPYVSGVDCEEVRWEVVDVTGEALLYRRILGHSHVSEQPFVRSGGPVSATSDVVIVRSHGNVGGYGS
jgi:hypothetical protein